jgi:hypothetical protein
MTTKSHITRLRGNSQTIRVAATAPTDADLAAGDIYWDSVLLKFGTYTGSAWLYSAAFTSTSTSTT